MALFLQEYEKLRKIGEGAFASVYKVRHADLGYVRALKVSNGIVDDYNDPKYRTFLNECRVLLKIGNGSHPNIVHIYQPRLIDNKAVVEMDYVDGMTLMEYLKEKPWMPMDEVRRFATQIVGALAYCHADLYRFLMDPEADDLTADPDDGSKFIIDPEKEAQLIAKYCVNHNDLHSNNIMRRSYDGSFVLLDFGLAIQDNHCVKSSSRGDGAYEYSSPEKLDGKQISSASDVYSLGILLYEVLAGQVPFVLDIEGKGLEPARFEVFQKHKQDTPPPIEPLRRKTFEKAFPDETYVKDYPDGLEQVIMRCLEKNPADRYPDAKALMQALQQVFDTTERPERDTTESIADDLAYENQRLRKKVSLLRAQLDEIPSESTSSAEQHKTIINLRNQLSDMKRENMLLRTELNHARSGMSRQESYIRQQKSRFSPLWTLAFICMLVSTAWTFFLFDNSSYFTDDYATIDRITVFAGIASLSGLGIVGLFPRVNIIVWCIAGMVMALTGTMQYFSSFDEHFTLCIISATALIVYVILWIRNEIRKSQRQSGSGSEQTQTSYL